MKLFVFFSLFFTTLNIMAQYDSNKIADSLYLLGNYSKAIAYYQKGESTINNQISIAKAYNAIGNYDGAIQKYEQIIAKDSLQIIAQYELGKLYYKTSQTNKAKSIFKLLVKKDSLNPNYYYQIGMIKMQEKDSSFIVDLKKAVKIDSTHLKSIQEIAKHYLINFTKDSTLYYTDLGLRFYKNSPALTSLKGQYLYTVDKDSAAIVEFEKLLTLGQKTEFIYEKLANAYLSLNDYENALKYYEILLVIDDENPRTHYNMGIAYQQKQENEKAIYHIEESLRLKYVSKANEYLKLTELYKDINDLKNTIKYYKLLINEVPDYTMGYYQLALMSDVYYKDPNVKLYHFQNFRDKASSENKMTEYADRRISELKAEIHLQRE
ncbi:tetratricopeptide repeat protein [Leptobacterium sp. I13]|uniref:tetratricopeptide repeat protein n=1 Tax=Leptobacterium meishanense TaxID=3128904 RepID=UPI0030EB2E16